MPRNPAPPLEEVQAVSSAWAIGAVRRLEEVEGGASHRVYRVETEDGTTAYLRCYARPNADIPLREHALIASVRALGFPAAPALAARDGGTVATRGGRLYALYQAARGAQRATRDLSEREAWSCGETLGRLHEGLAVLPDAGYVRWSLNWDGAEWRERLARVESAIVARGLSDARDASALRRVRAQREWLGHPDCVHAHRLEWSCQVVHGDYQHANVFFEAGEVSGIIDWDQAAYMPRAYEAVRACAFMFPDTPRLAKIFLDAYGSASGAGERELAAGARAWGCFADHHVWPVEEVYLHGNQAARRFIPSGPFRPFAQLWAELA